MVALEQTLQLGLTRGVGATMLRETPGNAIFFLRRAGLSAHGAGLHLRQPSSADVEPQLFNLLMYVHAPDICGDPHCLPHACYMPRMLKTLRMLQHVIYIIKMCQCVCSYEGLRKVVPGRPASSGERRGALALLSDAASSIVCGGAAGMIMWSVVPPRLHRSAFFPSRFKTLGLKTYLTTLLDVCGGAAGMIMWSVVPPRLHRSAFFPSRFKNLGLKTYLTTLLDVCGGAAGMIMWSVVPPCLHGRCILCVCSAGCVRRPARGAAAAKPATCVTQRNLILHLGYRLQTLLRSVAAAAANPGPGMCATTWAPLKPLGGSKPHQHSMLCSIQRHLPPGLQVLPLDVAKTRRQTAGPGSRYDVGTARNLALLWAEGGRRALYAGLTPTLLRAFPANAAQWLAWECAVRTLRDKTPSG